MVAIILTLMVAVVQWQWEELVSGNSRCDSNGVVHPLNMYYYYLSSLGSQGSRINHQVSTNYHHQLQREREKKKKERRGLVI